MSAREALERWTQRLDTRCARIDWEGLRTSLDRDGFARVPGVLHARECDALARLYDRDALFRKTISMDAQRFGSGEYRYFANPLPPAVQALRQVFFAPLSRIANGWQKEFGRDERFPSTLGAWLRRCHAAGQRRPTPLLLRYREGGFNNLHQDLYGNHAFPLQLTVQLSRPGIDFEGGEFLLVEQRPRQQSRGCAVALARGEGILFPTRERPVSGARGYFRGNVRHGVSPLRSGSRTALGVIFHDAK